MKRFFLLFAAAALTLAACNKPQYIIPVDNEEEKEDPGTNPGTNPEDGIKETTLTVNITLQDGVNNNYDGTVGVMPGAQILEALDMTEAEFYKAMGTYTGSAYPDPQTSQENNTIMFGVAEANNTDNLKWIPASSNNFGHWFTAEGNICAWGDDATFFTESLTEWGLDAPDADVLAGMWKFTVGCFPDRTHAGETYKATEVFFYTDDDDVENYVYVQWVIKIEEAEEVTLTVVGTQTIDLELEYDGGYLHTPFEDKIDAAAIQSGIGISYNEATVYAVNADGSFGLAPGVNFWFDKEGNICGWGNGCGIDLGNNEYPEGAPVWCVCNFPDETLAGTKVTGAIAFVNPNTNNAYVVRVNVTFPGIDYLSIDVLVSYELGESIYTLNENNLAALAAALGVESVAADEIGTTYPIQGYNADGSLYEGSFTANNGFWYSSTGNVTSWGSEDFDTYIEYRGDYNFGCGLWEESGVSKTVKIGVGDAILTFNLTVDEPKSFDTEEVGAMEFNVTQTLAAGYGGAVIDVDYSTLCEKLGLTDETFDDGFMVLGEGGTVSYTGEYPGGFWYNANGEICNWGDDGSCFFLNVKYGEDLPEGAASKIIINTGIRAEENHVTAPGTFTGKILLANPEAGKHVTAIVNLEVTE